jgi:hypothetical protein
LPPAWWRRTIAYRIAAKPPADDRRSGDRLNELEYVAKLLKASARLTIALAHLRGDTSHRIHVTHAGKGDKG